jgi:RES domain-containing protein
MANQKSGSCTPALDSSREQSAPEHQVSAGILVHFEIDIQDLPIRYRLSKIEAPDDVQVERVSVDQLPADWLEKTEVTRALGDGWLKNGSAPVLSVPSAIVPETFNVLLNPAHRDARRIVIIQTGEHAIDPRLFK